MYAADTIVAIATAPGPAAVGIVRISGPGALRILALLQRSGHDELGVEAGFGNTRDTHRLRLIRIFDTHGELIDQALGVRMLAPASYTGEDVVEIHCHGGPAVLRQVVAAALAFGARLAQAGEFTRRAFFNGRLDLVQAEAIDDLIHARGRGQAAVAVQQVAGQLSIALGKLREQLIEIKALLEVQIDFSEEDVAIDRDHLIALSTSAADDLDRLVESYDRGRMLREGVRIAIAGKPNVGKSSLMNALLGEERAIVTEIAGTTRDVIEESIELAGIRAVLSDTAGLRSLDLADRVEQIGIGRAHAEIEHADCALVVIDRSAALDDDDERVLATTSSLRRVIAVNKSDLPAHAVTSERLALLDDRTVKVSARTGDGLSELRAALIAAIETGWARNPASAVLTRTRQRDAVAKAAAAVRLALGSLGEGQTPDLIAVDIQDALEELGELTGAISHEDVLDKIFSSFCIGK